MELGLHADGFRRVAGIDEAGRGPLAGPVVAAAVVLDPRCIPPGLADSKLLKHEQREALFAAICDCADISFAFGCVSTVDRINIREATLAAMRRALKGLSHRADMAIIDGRDVPKRLGVDARAIIDGDAICLSIAAASIIAKVIRDRLMTRCDTIYEGYGLASHKGYSTKAHQSALTTLGPTPLHRRSFAPVRACFEKMEPVLVPEEPTLLFA
nr:ribonuclease HII [Faunimonas pinastri]